MQELRDIKDIVEVSEYSLETLIAVIIALVFLASILIYLYKNRRVRKKRKTKRELAKQRLKNIDFDDIKKTVYTFSVDGYEFVNDENIDKFKEIEKELQKYKYQKVVPQLDDSTKELIKEFIKGIR